MTLQEIVDACRDQFGNYQLPYYHLDREMARYANNAVNEICRDGRVLEDSLTASICQFSTTADAMDYALNASIIYVKEAKVRTEEYLTLDVAPATAWSAGDTLTGALSTKTCKVVEKVSTYVYKVENRTGAFTLGEIISNGTYTADQGASYPIFTESESSDLIKYTREQLPLFRTYDSSEPYGYFLDDTTGYITITKPDDVYVIDMSVIRYPASQLSATSMSSQTPEINAKYHSAIIDGILYQMYLKRGDETFDPKKSDLHYKLFRNAISNMKKENLRLQGNGATTAPHEGFI
ncbi:MAG: DUF6682 family protein [Clostridia bacterium]|jgi:hypothetical protein